MLEDPSFCASFKGDLRRFPGGEERERDAASLPLGGAGWTGMDPVLLLFCIGENWVGKRVITEGSLSKLRDLSLGGSLLTCVSSPSLSTVSTSSSRGSSSSGMDFARVCTAFLGDKSLL